MYVLGHNHERIHAHAIEHTGAFQGLYEKVAHCRVGQVRVAVETGESDEVRRSGMVRAVESAWHVLSVASRTPQLPTAGNCGPPAGYGVSQDSPSQRDN